MWYATIYVNPNSEPCNLTKYAGKNPSIIRPMYFLLCPHSSSLALNTLGTIQQPSLTSLSLPWNYHLHSPHLPQNTTPASILSVSPSLLLFLHPQSLMYGHKFMFWKLLLLLFSCFSLCCWFFLLFCLVWDLVSGVWGLRLGLGLGLGFRWRRWVWGSRCRKWWAMEELSPLWTWVWIWIDIWIWIWRKWELRWWRRSWRGSEELKLLFSRSQFQGMALSLAFCFALVRMSWSRKLTYKSKDYVVKTGRRRLLLICGCERAANLNRWLIFLVLPDAQDLIRCFDKTFIALYRLVGIAYTERCKCLLILHDPLVPVPS